MKLFNRKKILSTVLMVAMLITVFVVNAPPMGVKAATGSMHHLLLIDGRFAYLWTEGEKAYGYYKGHLYSGRYDVIDDKTVYVLNENDFVEDHGIDGTSILKVVVSPAVVAYEYRRYELKDGSWILVERKIKGQDVFQALDKRIMFQGEHSASVTVRGENLQVPIYLIGNKENCLSGIRVGRSCGPIYESFFRTADGEIYGTGKNSVLPEVQVAGVNVRPVRFQPAVYMGGTNTMLGFGMWISADELKSAYAKKWNAAKNNLTVENLRIANLDIEIGMDEKVGERFITAKTSWDIAHWGNVNYFSPAKAFFYEAKPVLIGAFAIAGSVVGISYPIVGVALSVVSQIASVSVRSVGWEEVAHGYATTVRVTTGYWYKVYIYEPVNASFSSGEWARLDVIPSKRGFYPVYASISSVLYGDNYYAEIYGVVEIKGTVKGAGHSEDFDIYVPVRLLYKIDSIINK